MSNHSPEGEPLQTEEMDAVKAATDPNAADTGAVTPGAELALVDQVAANKAIQETADNTRESADKLEQQGVDQRHAAENTNARLEEIRKGIEQQGGQKAA